MFIEKMRRGEVALGATITVTDATITEALCGLLDCVFIDMEHNALSLEVVQAHIIATKGTTTTPLVRVPWNDPVLIKPVLDIGAAGVVVPMIRTVDDVRRAVAACRYPPDGIRGYGPRRPSNYGRLSGPEFCRAANEAMIIFVQIEEIEAVNNLDEILAVPGLTGILIGANDLSGSMGLMGQPRHPDVIRTAEKVIARTRQAGLIAGMAVGNDPALLKEWMDKGAQWLAIGDDYGLMIKATSQVVDVVRDYAQAQRNEQRSAQTTQVKTS